MKFEINFNAEGLDEAPVGDFIYAKLFDYAMINSKIKQFKVKGEKYSREYKEPKQNTIPFEEDEEP